MAEIKIVDVINGFRLIDATQRKTIPLREWLGREPTEEEKAEVSALNQTTDRGKYFQRLIEMKANG